MSFPIPVYLIAAGVVHAALLYLYESHIPEASGALIILGLLLWFAWRLNGIRRPFRFPVDSVGAQRAAVFRSRLGNSPAASP